MSAMDACLSCLQDALADDVLPASNGLQQVTGGYVLEPQHGRRMMRHQTAVVLQLIHEGFLTGALIESSNPLPLSVRITPAGVAYLENMAAR